MIRPPRPSRWARDVVAELAALRAALAPLAGDTPETLDQLAQTPAGRDALNRAARACMRATRAIGSGRTHGRPEMPRPEPPTPAAPE